MTASAADWAPRAEPLDGGRAREPETRRRDLVVGGASLAVHILLAVLVLLVVPRPRPAPEEKSVRVEILDARQFDAQFGPPDTDLLPTPVLPGSLQLPQTPPTILSFPAGPEMPPHAGETIVARTFLSAATLANPASAEAKLALTRMGGDERIVQLCVIEALDQIAALDTSFAPDMIAPYSVQDLWLGQRTVDAPGAAFRSKGKWYNLSFRCTLSPKLDKVAAFQFRLGAEVPHQDWERYKLVEGEDLDGH